MTWFFDRYGFPSILLNEGRFVDKRGRNLGYIHQNGTLYNYQGRHCGWIKNGVIRDLHGSTAAFCIGASDAPSPIFPIPQIPPVPAVPQIPPVPAVPQVPQVKPVKNFSWSTVSPVGLFS